MYENPRIMIIDFANVMFSGWYTKQELNASGVNVNAVITFIRRLRLLKETYSPKYIVMAEDVSRQKTFRKQLYPEYKGKRKPMDPDIGKQMDIVKALITAIGYPRISNELYEADDIAGMISQWGEENNYETIIVSSDKDMYQLVRDHTFITCPRTNIFVDKDYLNDMYGLTPSQWIELKILQGDPSDNIPGVPGIGNKTALLLMGRYNSIENIYNHLNELKPGVRNALTQNQSVIEPTRTLVTILTDYNLIQFKEEMLNRSESDLSAVESILREYSIYSLDDTIFYGLCPQITDLMEVPYYDEAKNYSC